MFVKLLGYKHQGNLSRVIVEFEKIAKHSKTHCTVKCQRLKCLIVSDHLKVPITKAIATFVEKIKDINNFSKRTAIQAILALKKYREYYTGIMFISC